MDEYTAEQIAWFESHCASCGKKDPGRVRVSCGECFHAWRWRWQLSWHDMRVRWALGGWQFHGDLVPDPWWVRVWNSIPRVPSRVWVCPCCSHDL